MIGPNTMILDSDGHNLAPNKRWGNSPDAEEIIIENN